MRLKGQISPGLQPHLIILACLKKIEPETTGQVRIRRLPLTCNSPEL